MEAWSLIWWDRNLPLVLEPFKRQSASSNRLKSFSWLTARKIHLLLNKSASLKLLLWTPALGSPLSPNTTRHLFNRTSWLFLRHRRCPITKVIAYGTRFRLRSLCTLWMTNPSILLLHHKWKTTFSTLYHLSILQKLSPTSTGNMHHIRASLKGWALSNQVKVWVININSLLSNLLSTVDSNKLALQVGINQFSPLSSLSTIQKSNSRKST